eukprot:11360034-Alexandrium_andersonii.AAC.1
MLELLALAGGARATSASWLGSSSSRSGRPHRADDTLECRPSLMKRHRGVLEGRIERTKTSGPGKLTRWLPLSSSARTPSWSPSS